MNLHGLASSAVSVVNPKVEASLRISDGYDTGDDGKRAPKYLPARRVEAQVQPLTWRDMQLIDGLTLQGTRRKIYLFGEVDGLSRPDSKGGDLVTLIDDGTVWLVAQVLEQWPDWASVAATQQTDSP